MGRDPNRESVGPEFNVDMDVAADESHVRDDACSVGRLRQGDVLRPNGNRDRTRLGGLGIGKRLGIGQAKPVDRQ